jgi:uncharacterized repeat protein (TIGR01451 family)
MIRLVFKMLVLLLTGVIMLFGASGPSQAQDGRPRYLPDEVLVKFKGDANLLTRQAALERVKGKVIKNFHIVSLSRVKIPADTVEKAVSILNTLAGVEYAEPNYLRHINAVPNDPSYFHTWGLHNTGQTGGTVDADIDAPEAWDLTTGSPDMVVAVIDSGMDMAHEDLAANIWTNPGEIPGNGIDDDGNGYVDDVHGWDFSRDDNDPSDTEAACMGHGTHTSGTVGAVGNNGIGVTGVNWDVKVMPLKIFRTYLKVLCSASSADIIDAVEYAADMGVRVSNNGYGGGSFSQAEYDAILASRSIFVAAAGNKGRNNDSTPSYPASYTLDNVIAVAATDHNDAPASFSNYGIQSVDLSAPGVNILSTLPGNTYDYYDGTSMASPHVAGAVGLLIGYDPSLTNREIKWRILYGTDYIGIPVLSGGRLNVYNSLTLPSPQVSIDLAAVGPTVVLPGDTISYSMTLTNTGTSSVSFKVFIVAVFPDGRDRTLAQRTLIISGGVSASRTFSTKLPIGLSPGEYQILGRADASPVSFDEDVVAYTIVP